MCAKEDLIGMLSSVLDGALVAGQSCKCGVLFEVKGGGISSRESFRGRRPSGPTPKSHSRHAIMAIFEEVIDIALAEGVWGRFGMIVEVNDGVATSYESVENPRYLTEKVRAT